MPHYFFDSYDGASLIRDDVGLELDGLEAAKQAATASLGDWARDELPKSQRKELAVQVRDETGKTVARACLWLEVETVQHQA